MYPFDTVRGRLLLGIFLASGGGMFICYFLEQATEGSQRQLLQTLLIFWLIFVSKTTASYMRALRDQQSGEGTAAAAAAGTKPQKAAAAAAGSGEEEDEEGEAGPVRRRRTRRD